MRNDDSVQRLLKDRRGSAVIHFNAAEAASLFSTKTTITSSAVGAAVSGVLPIERAPGIVQEPRQQLFLRNLLQANPTVMQAVDFVRVSVPMSPASPVPESSVKPENQLNFVSVSEKVRLLAHWIPATRQIIDDMQELMSFLNSTMPYYTLLAEEQQMLSGDGNGENLHGILPQASAFQPSLLPTGGTRIDYIGASIEQLAIAKELPPSFVVMNPFDWWRCRLLKNTLGNYIIGDPQTSAAQRLFDLDVVSTVNIAPGQFLVGTANPAGIEIRDRQELVIEISTEHANYFIQNMVAIRCEKRLCLLTKRPGSFIQGSFSGTNPA